MSHENKSAFLQKVESRLKEWDAELQILQAKVDRVGADARVKYLEKVQELKQKRGELQERARQIKDSAAESWESLTDGLESSWSQLKSGLKSALDSIPD
ncbi:MAG TPA: hypothetical protein ENN21_08495 [Spirochaetes bacterium]|nr:hypothetical protein [Spirochaetota bacterium]